MLCLISATALAQQSEWFNPVRKNSLRLPSVPIIANDPYFCVWSPYDKLYDGLTTYFSENRKELTGILRVDSMNYRFIGVNLTTTAPLATEENWNGRYVKTKPAGTWYVNNYDDTSWNTGKAAEIRTIS